MGGKRGRGVKGTLIREKSYRLVAGLTNEHKSRNQKDPGSANFLIKYED